MDGPTSSKFANEAGSETAMQRDPSLSADRHDVEAVCLGGLRSAYVSSCFLPRGRILFNVIRKKFLSILTPVVVSEAVAKLGSDCYSMFSKDIIAEARAAIANTCNIEDCDVSWTTPNSPLRGKLVKALAIRCGDWDMEAVRWINGHGAPLGINLPIIPNKIFPVVPLEDGGCERAAPRANFISPHEVIVNYPSAEDNPSATMELLEEERRQGFCRFFRSYEDLVAELGGERFVVSKIALAEKGADDRGMMKYRMIVDGSESGVNELISTCESVELPRIIDVVEDWKGMAAGRPVSSANGLLLVVDFRSAFKLIPTAREELQWCVCYFQGIFILYDCLQFGFSSSPLLWGREAALFARMGQLILSPDGGEGRINTYVDDPIISVYAKEEGRRRQLACLPLLLWECFGCPYSCKKGQCGTKVKWIGRMLEIVEDAIVVYVPVDKLAKVKGMISESLQARIIKVARLRSMCGKLTWVSQVARQLASFVAPLWAIVAKAEKDGRNVVAIGPVCWSLDWLCRVIDDFIEEVEGGDGKYLVRRFPLSSKVSPGSMMVVDACWRGIGGVLMVEGKPVEWFADSISAYDRQYLGIDENEDLSRYQNAMELLAILVGTRLWARSWPRGVPITVRSDSVVAIASAVKMKSKSAVINKIAMELAYDGARNCQVLDMRVEHIEGVQNCWADALSRLQLGATMPAELAGVPEASCPTRGQSFWKMHSVRSP